MVTLTNPNNILEEPNRWVGLSTDSKPDTAHNGDEFVEMDTSKQYMYDEESADWVEIAASGGGGGGGGGSGTFVVHISSDTADKTYSEIVSAIEEGNIPWAVVQSWSGNTYYTFSAYDEYGVSFYQIHLDSGGVYYDSLQISSGNTVNITPYMYPDS